MNRKNFLKSVALGGFTASVVLSSCGGEAPKTEGGSSTPTTPESAPAAAETAAPAADCNDLTGLAEADLKQREAVGYVVKSTEAEKNCGNCRFMKPGSEANGCNGCQLFKGPVNPEGYCKSWFKKDA